MDDSDIIIAGTQPSIVNPDRYHIYFGEAIYSMRSVLRRYVLNRSWQMSSNGDGMVIFNSQFSRFPASFGYDPYGLERAYGVVVTASLFPFNFTYTTPFNWLAACFIAYRGSMNWTFNLQGLTSNTVRVIRNAVSTTNSSRGVLHYLPTNISNDARSVLANSYSGAGGQLLTNQVTQSGINVQLPNFSKFKFQSTRPSTANSYVNPTTGLIDDDSAFDTWAFEAHLPSETAA